MGSYVGESEAKVRKVFAGVRTTARDATAATAVLFFDELDSLAPRCDGNGSNSRAGVMGRVVLTLCSELDRTSIYNDDNTAIFLFVLAATNRPDLLDTSLLCP